MPFISKAELNNLFARIHNLEKVDDDLLVSKATLEAVRKERDEWKNRAEKLQQMVLACDVGGPEVCKTCDHYHKMDGKLIYGAAFSEEYIKDYLGCPPKSKSKPQETYITFPDGYYCDAKLKMQCGYYKAKEYDNVH